MKYDDATIYDAARDEVRAHLASLDHLTTLMKGLEAAAVTHGSNKGAAAALWQAAFKVEEALTFLDE